ncbi:Transposon Ty3-I Gag-Pol polyprotein [Vitis vinifera]|uniref:Transposon Ty3-I Gag-Pol polyprotein n=1 Tax=Vitis vinifera TaxID=29760 RepID=A0A438IJI8_VITVI|nr:Transposon Ty3-I Gag-Pol polyprotein [Vitis vinifera]
MRQRRWIELLKDYDCIIQYHPGKVNVVVNALSRKSFGSLEAIKDDEILRFRTRLCVPNNGDLKKELLEKAPCSRLAIHLRWLKMYKDLRLNYWWSRLPRTLGANNTIWVIVDRLTKSAHFLPMKVNFSMDHLVFLYVKEIMRIHGVPISIASDRDPRFTSRFWHSLQKALGIKLSFSIAFHPQTDGQSERVIQVLEDLLKACTLDLKGSWDDYLPLVEFTYNNSFQASIGMTPFEGLYGRKCRSLVYWDDVGEKKLWGLNLCN